MMPLQRHIKNVVHNYTEAERKVREATSNDPWGPSSTLMSDIANRTYNVISFTEIMQMIWRRLNDKSKNWRHVYKALILLEYIIKTGSDKVAQQCRENIHAIETIIDFYYIEDGKNVGNNVREKARALNALLRDDERLQEERYKASLAQDRLMNGVNNAPLSSKELLNTTTNCRKSSQPSLSSNDVEFDSALPKSFIEEQRQLQLALNISKEEHERETRKRKEEETKEALKLQMALEQSKHDTQVRNISQSLSVPHSEVNGGGNLFNSINTSLSAAPANVPDPWSTVMAFKVPPPPTSSTVASNNWHNGKIGGEPLALLNTQESSLLDITSTPNDPHVYKIASDSNPWATLDPFIAPTPTISSCQNPVSNSCGNQQLTTLSCSNTTQRKRTPADFLGAHKDLVDLEKLVDCHQASTNPFATSTRYPVIQSTNPFNNLQPPKPSLNQLTVAPRPLALPSCNSAFQPPSSTFQFPLSQQNKQFANNDLSVYPSPIHNNSNCVHPGAFVRPTNAQSSLNPFT